MLARTIIETDTVWIVERKVPDRRLETLSTEPPRMEDLQAPQHISVPVALSDINVGDIIWGSDVPDSGISSGGDPQVLLEARDDACGTSLMLVVTGRSPGVKVRFQDAVSEIVISVILVWVVSGRLRTNSVVMHNIEGHKRELPGSTPPVVRWEQSRRSFHRQFSKRIPQGQFQS